MTASQQAHHRDGIAACFFCQERPADPETRLGRETQGDYLSAATAQADCRTQSSVPAPPPSGERQQEKSA